MDETKVLELLHKAAIKIEGVKEAKRLYGSQIAPDFRIFDYLRDDEMGLSKCIGDLLNPASKHSQGDTYLNLFLSFIDNSIEKQNSNNLDAGVEVIAEIQNFLQWENVVTDNCKMKLEHSTPESRRIDIHLQFMSGEVIGIENKPWAGDQLNQLSDYAKHLKDQAIDKEWLLIYLCNSEPDINSISQDERNKLESQGRILTLTYKELIDWLQQCINITKANVVRVFIEELIKFIKKEINREADMELTNQLSIVIQNHFDVAMQIANSIDEVKRNLLAKLKLDLSSKALEKGYKFNWKNALDSKWSTYSGFGFNFSVEPMFEFEVWFEFSESNLNGFYWGVRKKDNNVERNIDLWNKLNLFMATKYGPSKATAWWPWWSYYHAEDDFRNWEVSSKPWQAIQNNTLADKLITIVSEVHEYFSVNNNIRLINRDLLE